VEALLVGPAGLSEEGVDAYWTASKERLDRWAAVFDGATEAAADEPENEYHIADATNDEFALGVPLDEMLALAEEVLASEVLTRIWAAVLASATHLPAEQAAVAAGRSVFVAHQEIRRRVLSWMVKGPVAETPATDRLNLLRRRCERWTDLLLGRLQLVANVEAFAFDANRVREFADDYRSEIESGGFDKGWQALLASLNNSLKTHFTRGPVCPTQNSEIAWAVLASLSAEVFDGGELHWAWLYRVERTASNASRLVEQLLQLESPAANG
jgi:hypothetical protein